MLTFKQLPHNHLLNRSQWNLTYRKATHCALWMSKFIVYWLIMFNDCLVTINTEVLFNLTLRMVSFCRYTDTCTHTHIVYIYYIYIYIHYISKYLQMAQYKTYSFSNFRIIKDLIDSPISCKYCRQNNCNTNVE